MVNIGCDLAVDCLPRIVLVVVESNPANTKGRIEDTWSSEVSRDEGSYRPKKKAIVLMKCQKHRESFTDIIQIRLTIWQKRAFISLYWRAMRLKSLFNIGLIVFFYLFSSIRTYKPTVGR